MHIVEGMLPAKYALGYALPAGLLAVKGIRVYQKRALENPLTKQLTGLLTAGVFLISLIPVPVPLTGTSSHIGATPLAGIILGPFISLLISVIVLFFQAFFFGHGGLTTLGANTLSMGFLGGTIGYLVWVAGRKAGLNTSSAAGLAGFFGDIGIYIGTSAQLAPVLQGSTPFTKAFISILFTFLPTQLPMAVLEGIFTAVVVKFIAERRQDILIQLKVLDE